MSDKGYTAEEYTPEIKRRKSHGEEVIEATFIDIKLKLADLEATVREAIKDLMEITGLLPDMLINDKVVEPSVADYALHAKERYKEAIRQEWIRRNP